MMNQTIKLQSYNLRFPFQPILPEKSRFIEVSSSSITLHLPAWKDGGCRMSHFVVEHRKKDQAEWNQISNNVKPGGNFVVLDLDPAAWYDSNPRLKKFIN